MGIEDNVESGDLVTKINDEATKMNFDPVVKAAGVIFASDPTYTITDDKTTLSPTPPPTLPSTPPPTPAPLPRQTWAPPMSTNAVSKLSLGDQQQSTAGGKAMIVIVMLMPFLLAIGVFLLKKKKQNNAMVPKCNHFLLVMTQMSKSLKTYIQLFTLHL